MAMSKGAVTINPSTGVASGSGASKEMFDALDATIDYQGLEDGDIAAARQQLADLTNAIAVIIDHIKNNAVVSSTISTATANGVTVGGSNVSVTGTSSGTVS